jgi:hypothetical protein
VVATVCSCEANGVGRHANGGSQREKDGGGGSPTMVVVAVMRGTTVRERALGGVEWLQREVVVPRALIGGERRRGGPGLSSAPRWLWRSERVDQRRDNVDPASR